MTPGFWGMTHSNTNVTRWPFTRDILMHNLIIIINDAAKVILTE